MKSETPNPEVRHWTFVIDSEFGLACTCRFKLTIEI
jgi:hypothetical protein